MGPLNHGWYKLLDKALVGVSKGIVLRKVLADQLVMAPICCSFFYVGECCARRGRGEGVLISPDTRVIMLEYCLNDPLHEGGGGGGAFLTMVTAAIL